MGALCWEGVIGFYRRFFEANLPDLDDDELTSESKTQERVFAQAMINFLEQIRGRPEFADVEVGRGYHITTMQPFANHEKTVNFMAINGGTSYTMWIEDMYLREFPGTRISLPASEAVEGLENYIQQLRQEALAK